MNIFVEFTMLSLVAQTVQYKYDGLTNNLGNVFIDRNESDKTISVTKRNIEKKNITEKEEYN